MFASRFFAKVQLAQAVRTASWIIAGKHKQTYLQSKIKIYRDFFGFIMLLEVH